MRPSLRTMLAVILALFPLWLGVILWAAADNAKDRRHAQQMEDAEARVSAIERNLRADMEALEGAAAGLAAEAAVGPDGCLIGPKIIGPGVSAGFFSADSLASDCPQTPNLKISRLPIGGSGVVPGQCNCGEDGDPVAAAVAVERGDAGWFAVAQRLSAIVPLTADGPDYIVDWDGERVDLDSTLRLPAPSGRHASAGFPMLDGWHIRSSGSADDGHATRVRLTAIGASGVVLTMAALLAMQRLIAFPLDRLRTSIAVSEGDPDRIVTGGPSDIHNVGETVKGLLRERDERVATMTALREAELADLADILHGQALQTVSAIRMLLSADGQDNGRVRSVAEDAVTELRDFLSILRFDGLRENGLEAELQAMADRHSTPNVAVDVAYAEYAETPPHIAALAFSQARTLLLNAVARCGARTVHIEVECYRTSVQVEVTAFGAVLHRPCGIPESAVQAAELFGGTISADRTPAGDWQVRCTLPHRTTAPVPQG